MGLYMGTPKTINFQFGWNGQLMILGFPVLKHFRIMYLIYLAIRRSYPLSRITTNN